MAKGNMWLSKNSFPNNIQITDRREQPINDTNVNVVRLVRMYSGSSLIWIPQFPDCLDK